MKLSRISLMVVLAIAFVAVLTLSASAYTSSDLLKYVTGTHVIGGSQYRLTDAQVAKVEEYLNAHPVTDAQAAQIKSLLDQAKSKANGDEALSQMTSAEKAEVISLLQQAGSIAGLNVTVNTSSKTLTVDDGSSVLLSGNYVNSGNGGLTVKFSAGGDSSTGSANGSGAAAGVAANGGSRAFVYTGADNTVFAVIALLTVVAVATVSVKKVYAK